MTADSVRTNRFPKDLRLRSAAEFQRVYKTGSKKVSRCFVLFARPNGLGFNRFGMTTPRKLGKAHDRNRIRRRIREILRTVDARTPLGFDFVINPRQPANSRDYQDLRKELAGLLEAKE